MKTLKTTLLALLAVGLSVGAFFLGRQFSPGDARDRQKEAVESSTTTPTHVVAPGRIEPFGGIYDVFAPRGQSVVRYKQNSRGQTIAVGVTVKRGEDLVELSGHELLLQQTKLAEARRKDANKDIDAKISEAKLVVRGASLALEEARFKLAQVEADKDQTINEKKLANAKAKLDRLQKLADDPDTKALISVQQLADRKLEWENAQLELAKAVKQIARAEKAAKFAVSTAEENLKDAQQALTDVKALEENPPQALKVSEQLALTQLRLARILAPCSGLVLKVHVKPGETVLNTPLLQVGNVDQMQCVAAVSDRLVSKLKIHDRATITSPAFGERSLSGKVIRIGKIVGNSSMRMANPLALVDNRTVDVVLEIEKPDVALASRYVNLQVDVRIAISKSSRPKNSKPKQPSTP